MSLNCDAEKVEEKGKKYNKRISLKICTKQGMNLRMRCGNGTPE
jgi:hypothetical protein